MKVKVYYDGKPVKTFFITDKFDEDDSELVDVDVEGRLIRNVKRSDLMVSLSDYEALGRKFEDIIEDFKEFTKNMLSKF